MSLRWRLQIWHALILVAVLIVFGTIVYYLERRSRWQQVDAQLHSTAERVASGIDLSFPRPPWGERGGSHRRRDSREELESRRSADGDAQDDDVANESREDRQRPGRGGFPWWKARRPEIQFELPEDLRPRFEDGDPAGFYFLVWRGDGELLARSPGAPDVSYPELPLEERPRPARVIRQRGDLREVFFRSRVRTTVLVGRSMAPVHAAQNRFALLLAATGGGVLAVGLVGGYWLSSRAIRPIETISATAEAISADNFAQRIEVRDTESELGRLAAVLNSTFDRLQAAFEQQVQLTADASHELRTPLAVLLTNSELALSKPRSASEYREALETCLRAARRMKSLVADLLTLARMDSGELVLERSRFDLSGKARECVDLVRPLAEQRGIRIECDAAPTPIEGDPEQLSRVLTNLLSNAIHYNHDRGRVALSVGSANGAATVRISDTGIGIPPEDLPHVFDRFYRVDKARSRSEGGSGLGLSICQTIVAAHGGTITAASDGQSGATFEINLPRQSRGTA